MSNKTRLELARHYALRPDGTIQLVPQNTGSSRHNERVLFEGAFNTDLDTATILEFPTHTRSLRNHFGPAAVFERPDYQPPPLPHNTHNKSQQENPRAVALSVGYNSAVSAGRTAPWPTAHVADYTPSQA